MYMIKKFWKEISNAFWETITIIIDAFNQHAERILLSGLVAIIIFIAGDVITGKTIRTNGIVFDKVYKPESDYMTLEPRQDGNGNTVYDPVFHHDPAEYKFIVQDNSSNIVNVWCSQTHFDNTGIGSKIMIFSRYGGWTNWKYSSRTLDY